MGGKIKAELVYHASMITHSPYIYAQDVKPIIVGPFDHSTSSWSLLPFVPSFFIWHLSIEGCNEQNSYFVIIFITLWIQRH